MDRTPPAGTQTVIPCMSHSSTSWYSEVPRRIWIRQERDSTDVPLPRFSLEDTALMAAVTIEMAIRRAPAMARNFAATPPASLLAAPTKTPAMMQNMPAIARVFRHFDAGVSFPVPAWLPRVILVSDITSTSFGFLTRINGPLLPKGCFSLFLI
jgi:hypothetical protein